MRLSLPVYQRDQVPLVPAFLVVCVYSLLLLSCHPLSGLHWLWGSRHLSWQRWHSFHLNISSPQHGLRVITQVTPGCQEYPGAHLRPTLRRRGTEEGMAAIGLL